MSLPFGEKAGLSSSLVSLICWDWPVARSITLRRKLPLMRVM